MPGAGQCLLVALWTPWAAALAFAGGFEVPHQAAKATGQGDAYSAQADDPSAVHYNPGGLTQVKGTQATAGVYGIFPGFEFRGAAGDADSNDPIYIPHFYAVSDLGSERWRLGLGVNNVFGISEDWGDNGPLATRVTHADIR